MHSQPAKFVAKLRQGQAERAQAETSSTTLTPPKSASAKDRVLVGGQRMLLLKVWNRQFCVWVCVSVCPVCAVPTAAHAAVKWVVQKMIMIMIQI
jgi:hypothetical protein